MQRLEREYRARRKRGEIKDPIVASKWRATRLEHEIQDIGRTLKGKDLIPLFPVEEGSSVTVFLSPPNPETPQWHLSLRPELKGSRQISEFSMSPQTAVDLYGDRPHQALKRVKTELKK